MARPCLTDEYFDSLLQSCLSCNLRCSRSPPSTCQSYCKSSRAWPVKTTVKGTNESLWICLGTVLLLTATVFILSILVRKLHPMYSRKRPVCTEAGVVPKTACEDGVEKRENVKPKINILTDTNETEKGPEMNKAEVKDCACGFCHLPTLQSASDIFPLPAIEEGATALVTTKTSDYGSYISNVMGSAYVG